MRVWITRARPEAEATADRVRALGWEPLVEPLIELRPLPTPISLEGVGALAFTSRNGVRAFCAREPRRDLPAYAVGDGTAEAARQAGFTQVVSAHGDVAALALLITRDRARVSGRVLHLAPREPAGDLTGALAQAGVGAVSAPLYEAVPLPAGPATLARWETFAAVLFHSPKASRAMAEADPPPPGPPLFCISENAATPLRASYPHVRVAAEPTEAALLAMLGKPGGAG